MVELSENLALQARKTYLQYQTPYGHQTWQVGDLC